MNDMIATEMKLVAEVASAAETSPAPEPVTNDGRPKKGDVFGRLDGERLLRAYRVVEANGDTLKIRSVLEPLSTFPATTRKLETNGYRRLELAECERYGIPPWVEPVKTLFGRPVVDPFQGQEDAGEAGEPQPEDDARGRPSP